MAKQINVRTGKLVADMLKVPRQRNAHLISDTKSNQIKYGLKDCNSSSIRLTSGQTIKAHRIDKNGEPKIKVSQYTVTYHHNWYQVKLHSQDTYIISDKSLKFGSLIRLPDGECSLAPDKTIRTKSNHKIGKWNLIHHKGDCQMSKPRSFQALCQFYNLSDWLKLMNACSISKYQRHQPYYILAIKHFLINMKLSKFEITDIIDKIILDSNK